MPENNEGLRLSQLNQKIETVIENGFKDHLFWVIADVTNHSFKEKSKYHYFDLVEKAENSNELLAKIAGKAWGSGSNKIIKFEEITGQKFTNNINVLLRVKIAYHKVFGLSLEIVDIDPNYTIGTLERQKQATLLELVAKNPTIIEKKGDRYITRNSKLPLPAVIQRIAVVSSKTSAGNEDFQHTLKNNPFGYYFHIDNYHTIVQNDANSSAFLESLLDVFRSKIPYDVVVINRGGGAQTDFLIFDNYKIGLAIAKFPIPIITGIGHQKNETIADLMAHTQTKTPTKAAEFIISYNRHFEDSLLNIQKSVIIKSQQIFSNKSRLISGLNTVIINSARTWLNRDKDALIVNNQTVVNKTKTLLYRNKTKLNSFTSGLISRPVAILSNRSKDLFNKITNIQSFNIKYLKSQKAYLGHFDSVVRLMSPVNILKKGFAIVRHEGQITCDPDALTPGSKMEVILGDSSIFSTVNTKTKNNGKEFDL